MSELARRISNRDRVLAYLQAHGSATNVELAQVGGLRFGGRLDELREQYDIRTIQMRGGLFRYEYRGVRSAPVQESLNL